VGVCWRFRVSSLHNFTFTSPAYAAVPPAACCTWRILALAFCSLVCGAIEFGIRTVSFCIRIGMLLDPNSSVSCRSHLFCWCQTSHPQLHFQTKLQDLSWAPLSLRGPPGEPTNAGAPVFCSSFATWIDGTSPWSWDFSFLFDSCRIPTSTPVEES